MVPQAPPFPPSKRATSSPQSQRSAHLLLTDLIVDILGYAIAVKYGHIEACTEDCLCLRTTHYESLGLTVVLKCRTMLPNTTSIQSC
jgi:hypothetical protein